MEACRKQKIMQLLEEHKRMQQTSRQRLDVSSQRIREQAQRQEVQRRIDAQMLVFERSREPTELSFDNIPSVIEISKECCVCMEAEKLLLLGCQHVVCFKCIQQITQKISSQCPLCRVSIVKEMIKKI